MKKPELENHGVQSDAFVEAERRRGEEGREGEAGRSEASSQHRGKERGRYTAASTTTMCGDEGVVVGRGTVEHSIEHLAGGAEVIPGKCSEIWRDRPSMAFGAVQMR